jgi:hypothetical protein
MLKNADTGGLHYGKGIVTIFRNQKQISVRCHERLCISIDAVEVVQTGKTNACYGLMYRLNENSFTVASGLELSTGDKWFVDF